MQLNVIAYYTFIIYPCHIYCKIKRRLVRRLNPGFYSHIAVHFHPTVEAELEYSLRVAAAGQGWPRVSRNQNELYLTRFACNKIVSPHIRSCLHTH